MSQSRLRASLIPAALVLAIAALSVLVFRSSGPAARSAGLVLTGESSVDTAAVPLAGRYDLRAELLPTCQYTFYLTPKGQPWSTAGRAVASASGEVSVHTQIRSGPPGRFFVHAVTSPDEGCSWTLQLSPLP